MVAGTSIDPAEVEAFLGPAALIIAHNAGFDRRFLEKFCSAFTVLAWACSWAELPWAEEGFDSAKLAHLAAAFGFFHDGHRAVHDCHAGVEIPGSYITAERAGRAWEPTFVISGGLISKSTLTNHNVLAHTQQIANRAPGIGGFPPATMPLHGATNGRRRSGS
jgi:hypothetical protein